MSQSPYLCPSLSTPHPTIVDTWDQLSCFVPLATDLTPTQTNYLEEACRWPPKKFGWDLNFSLQIHSPCRKFKYVSQWLWLKASFDHKGIPVRNVADSSPLLSAWPWISAQCISSLANWPGPVLSQRWFQVTFPVQQDHFEYRSNVLRSGTFSWAFLPPR